MGAQCTLKIGHRGLQKGLKISAQKHNLKKEVARGDYLKD
jgi:hypothetical protein